MPDGYRLLWAGWYRLEDGAGPYAWDGAAGFALIGSGRGETAVGGGVLLEGETDGFATDFTHATDSERVAVKVASVNTSYALDAFYTNAGTSPKQVFDAAGSLVWSPHNMFLNSAAPVTQNVTTIVGQNYTVTIVGSGSMTGSAGASGVATAGAPLTYTATTVTSTFTKAGTVTQIQMNRGAVATAYIATTGAIKNGLAIDYDPVTHASKGLLVEPAATNLILNNASMSTQSVTVTAVAHTLSFWGTGTITLSGVSTAGPLVGTGVSNRVSLTFTPTAGSLTCTVTGTVSRAQLETGTVATSPIPTFAATATRVADNVTFLLSTIPALGSAYSAYCRFSVPTPFINSTRYAFALTDGTTNEFLGMRSLLGPGPTVTDGGALQANISVGTLVGNTPISAAMRVQANNFGASAAGGAVTTDTVGTLPTVTEVRFGNAGNNAATIHVFNIYKLMIVPRAWSDVELQAKSAVT